MQSNNAMGDQCFVQAHKLRNRLLAEPIGIKSGTEHLYGN
jgi:hypothetical protein